MGRPVIAADSIGTREPVIDGQTGFLCAPADPDSLADAMQRMIELGPRQRRDFGLAGRQLMENQYDVRFVVGAYLEKIAQVVDQE